MLSSVSSGRCTKASGMMCLLTRSFLKVRAAAADMMPLRSPGPPMAWLMSYFDAPVASCPSASAVPRVAEAMPLMIAALRIAVCVAAAFMAVAAAMASSSPRSDSAWVRFSIGPGVSGRLFGSVVSSAPPWSAVPLASDVGLDGAADCEGGIVTSKSSRTPLCTTTALTRARSLRLPSRIEPAMISPVSVSRAWPPSGVVYGVPSSASTGRPITQMAAAFCASISIVSEKFWSSRWQSMMLDDVYAAVSRCWCFLGANLRLVLY
mmetsp:Transcript_34980/g.81062  ORF Transcript_34980/g.81062 Transcript_34980/m.81062 type:complete len:264 (-) Transcript_34980:734-1525(-)